MKIINSLPKKTPIYEAQNLGLQSYEHLGWDSVSFRRVGSIYCTWALPLMLGGYCMANKSLTSMHAYTQTCLQVSLLTGKILTVNGTVTKFMWIPSYLIICCDYSQKLIKRKWLDKLLTLLSQYMAQ